MASASLSAQQPLPLLRAGMPGGNLSIVLVPTRFAQVRKPSPVPSAQFLEPALFTEQWKRQMRETEPGEPVRLREQRTPARGGVATRLLLLTYHPLFIMTTWQEPLKMAFLKKKR